MTTLADLDRIAVIIADMKQHAGQWTVIGEQVPNSRGRTYARRGCQVIYRNQSTRGTADVIARWPG